MRKLGKILLGVLGILGALIFTPSAPAEERPSLSEAGVSREALEQKHEVGDARPMWVVYCAIGLFATIFAIMAIMGWLHSYLHRKYSAPAVTQFQKSFRHAPYAQTNIADDWDKINKDTRRNLHTYRWIDRRHGIVGIPIERAMQLVGASGLPSRGGITPFFPAPGEEMRPMRRTENPDEITKSN